MKFAEGGIVPKIDYSSESIYSKLSSGTILVKKSIFDKNQDALSLPFMGVYDKIKVIDDELWDRLTPSEKGKLL